MQRIVKKVLIIRLHSNIAKAISTQPVFMYAFGFDDSNNLGDLGNDSDKLKIIPEDIREPKAVFDDIHHAAALIKAIRAEKPDVIHVNALQDLPFTLVAVHLSRRSKGRPKIIAMSHNPYTWKPPFKAWLATMIIWLFTDGYICSATTHQNQLLRLNFPKDRLIVIPNPYDMDQVDVGKTEIKSHLKPGNSLRVVYTANVCERKAQGVLVEAAALVLNKHPEVCFDMIGRVITGEEKYAQRVAALIQKTGIGKNVRLLGELPYREVIARVSACDIFAFPTRAEVMPRAVLEAMLAGKPVVASGVDGILDLIEHQRTGLLVQPGRPKELAEALCELIENPSLAHELGLAGQKHVLEFCSPQRTGALFQDFYQYISNK
jgi:glycosyltransferase involved in cell wall biosynthesis